MTESFLSHFYDSMGMAKESKSNITSEQRTVVQKLENLMNSKVTPIINGFGISGKFETKIVSNGATVIFYPSNGKSLSKQLTDDQRDKASEIMSPLLEKFSKQYGKVFKNYDVGWN